MTLLLGAIYLKCEDTKSVISTLISKRPWSTVGLFHSTDEKSTLDLGTKYYLFDIADASRPQHFNIDCTLRSLIEHPLVSRVGIQSYIVERKTYDFFKLVLLREVGNGTSDGATIINRVFSECQLDQKQEITEMQLPEKKLSDFLQSRILADNYHKKSIISSIPPDTILLRLIACHDYLTRFLPFENDEVKRVIGIMNDYRYHLDLSLIQRIPGIDCTKGKAKLSICSISELRDLLHYLDSLGDPALRDMENLIMKELASRPEERTRGTND